MTFNLNFNKINFSFFLLILVVISFSSITESKAINYEKLYKDNNIEVLKLDYVIRLKIIEKENNYLLEIRENNKVVIADKINITDIFMYFLPFGNNSIKISLNNEIIIDQYFNRNDYEDYLLNNLITLIFFSISGLIILYIIKDRYYNNF